MLLSCARARLILPLWPLHLNFMYTCRKSHNEFTERNLSIGLCILAGSDAEWQYQFLRIVFFNPLWNRAVRYGKMENIKGNRENRLPFVGVLRLERRTLCSQSRYANQLRHTPNYSVVKYVFLWKWLQRYEYFLYLQKVCFIKRKSDG